MTDDTWTVAVQIPAALPGDIKDSLFAAVADAVHDWEPETRDGWDVHVTGYTPRGAGWADAAIERARTQLIVFDDSVANLAEHGTTPSAKAIRTAIAAALAALDPPAKEKP